jgi:adenosylmethionine-8-amino-7-oxononanoate aminotransferase
VSKLPFQSSDPATKDPASFDPAPSGPEPSPGDSPSLRPTLVRGEGVHVWDADGRRYLDAISGTFCVQLGYGRADLTRAMSDAAARLPFARPSTFESEESEAYARDLLEAVGPPFTRLVFTSSGSEAIEVALKAAYFYRSAIGVPERARVTHLEGHFHGGTIEALRVTGYRTRRAPYEALLGTGHPVVDPTREGALEEALRDSFALIAETIPVAGLGAAVPAPGSLARMRRACDAAGTLWIADEVATGFGRVGSLFAWKRLAERREDAGLAPDIICFGKGAGCGYAALGGILIRDRVAAAFDRAAGGPFLHAQILERVREKEGVLRAALDPLASHAHVRNVRGLGFLWGVELQEDSRTGAPFPRELRIAERVEAACRDRGLLIFSGSGSADGQNGDHIVIGPPLVSDPHHFSQIAIGIREALDEVTSARR